MHVNQEILKTEAAKKYWQTHNFDPVSGSYVDEDIEKKFLENRAAKEKNHGKDIVKKLPQIVQTDGMLYNPINGQVDDETRLNEREQREANKKKRFETKHAVDLQVQKETLAEKERLDKMSLQKVSHQRVAEEINRGFDVITNGELRGGLAQINATNFMQQQPKAWDKISPRNMSSMNQGEGGAASGQQSTFDFQGGSNFDRRSKRINRSMGPGAQQAAAPSQSNYSSN